MHELLWEKLAKLDGKTAAVRSQCGFDEDSRSYTVPLLGVEFAVEVAARRVCRADDASREANFLEQLCVLAYLLNSTQVPVAKRLVSGDKLDSGQFFFRGPHELPVGKLEEVFGDEPELLYEAAEGLGDRCEYGDASVEIAVFPRLSVVFVVWGRDEEFEARASILFDETADKQLPLDALGAAVQLAVGEIVKRVG